MSVAFSRIYSEMQAPKPHSEVKHIKVEYNSVQSCHESSEDESSSDLERIPVSKQKVLSSWNDYPWICALCSEKFSDIVNLRAHAKIKHKNCGVFKCFDCSSCKFKDNFSLFIKHVKKHRKYLWKRCHYCNIHIKKEEVLLNHLTEHFEKTFIACRSCGEIFNRKKQLLRHVSQFTDDSEKYQKGYKYAYNEDKPYTCDLCGDLFLTKYRLTYHLKLHDRIQEFICEICEKSFAKKRNLKNHRLTHTDVKDFQCEICSKTFRTKRHLKDHKIIHTDLMPYTCQVCGKLFRRKHSLTKHFRQHTGEKPYICEICHRDFTDIGNRKKHMLRAHNKETGK